MRDIRLPALALVLTLVLAACGNSRVGMDRRRDSSPATPARAGAANAREETLFSGTVVDAEGRPVAGAAVAVYRYGMTPQLAPGQMVVKRTVTGAAGSFELRGSRNGTVLVASKPGLAPAWKLSRLKAATRGIRLILTQPSFLGGVMVDEKGRPVTNAEVYVSVAVTGSRSSRGLAGVNLLGGKPARELFHARSGRDGRFRIENFPTNATAGLLARVPGMSLRQTEGLNRLDSLYHPGRDDIRLVMEPAGSVEGSITCEGSVQPPPRARLELLPEFGGIGAVASKSLSRSAADGSFRIKDVAAGTYRLRAFFGTNRGPDWVAAMVPVTVESGRVTSNVQVAARRGGLLEVTVREKDNSKRRAGCGVAFLIHPVGQVGHQRRLQSCLVGGTMDAIRKRDSGNP